MKGPRILMAEAAEGDAGSAAPAPESQSPLETKPEPKQAPPAPVSSEERKAKTAGDLKARIAAERAARAADDDDYDEPPAKKPAPKADKEAGNKAKIDAAPTDKAEKAAKELDAKGEKVPEQKEGESDSKYTLKLAKLAQDLRDLEGRERRERTSRETAERKSTELEAALKKAEGRLARGKDPEAVLEFLLEETGQTLEDIVKGINDGKIKPPRPKASLSPEVAAELEQMRKASAANAEEVKALREKEEAREQERAQAQQRQAFDAHVGQAKKWIEENSDDYPMLAATSWAPSTVVQNAYGKKTLDISGPAREIEEAVATNVLAVLGNERALKALAKRDPELGEKIAAALGLSTAEAEPKIEREPQKKDRPVSKVSSEAPTPRRLDSMDREERKKHVSAGLKNRIRELRDTGSD